jgi:hypothetical protein
MKTLFAICASLALQFVSVSSPAQSVYYEPALRNEFAIAYQQNPSVPSGVLEAVAFTNTRMSHLTDNDAESCTGMSKHHTMFGLVEQSDWFRPNLTSISALSGISTVQIKNDRLYSIKAFASAYSALAAANNQERNSSATSIYSALTALSEFPLPLATEDSTMRNQKQYVLDVWMYSIFGFLNDERHAGLYGFQVHNINLREFFGDDNYALLSSPAVRLTTSTISSSQYEYHYNEGVARNAANTQLLSPDYGPALWNPAGSCNYSSRNNVAVSAVTIHTVQGSYAGCISWFQNCNAGVSAHYVLRSSDGQITQMVLESNKAWHVGSENPYTIGLEHEGYVNNASWYTTAMYQSSAAVVKDICNDYSINPKRTGFWPWLATTYYNQSGIPGACSRVKGHQHYPNQIHTDPGVNWNWNYYYQLINSPSPAATVYTTSSGNFFDSGGNAGNYVNDERLIWIISPASATNVTVSFTSFSVENTWDYLYVYDGNSINAPLIGYYTGTQNPGTITSSGSSLTFEFRSDCATVGAGWNASWTSSASGPSADAIAPTTVVNVVGIWQTGNFQTSFSDSDNIGGSGLEKSFYQVLDYDGADWRANSSRGFFSDNFDQTTIHPEWTVSTGSWSIANGVLNQSDENQNNTNIYASLTQNLSNKYLYHWAGKIDGTGNNRRAGFHYFCDNPTLPNRGNSYFVWFRVDQSQLEFYKVVNDVFTLEHSVPITVTIGQWYDWKVIYDRVTGETDVYQDNQLVGTWTDPQPLSTGNSISFRSGNSNWSINNFKIYRSRFSNAPLTVTVGNCPGCDLRYQNTSPNVAAGRVKSIVRDSMKNLSAIAYQDINVDWTVPTSIDTINDGPHVDVDLWIFPSYAEGNWSGASDPHSGLFRYWFALGTTAGDSDVVAWTSNWGYDTVVMNNLTLQNGQWYYLAVRAENGAGLITNNFISDGFYVDLTTGMLNSEVVLAAGIFPNPIGEQSVVQIVTNTTGPVTLSYYDLQGKLINTEQIQLIAGINVISSPTLHGLATGTYLLRVNSGGRECVVRIIK